MATTIITKHGEDAPLDTDLVQGELALDLKNKRIYSKDPDGNIIQLGSDIDIPDGVNEDDLLLWSDDDDKWTISEYVPSTKFDTSPPANPKRGMLWQDTTNDEQALYCFDGTVWFEISGANGADGSDGNIQDGASDGSQDGIVATWDSTYDQWRANDAVVVDASGNATFSDEVNATRIRASNDLVLNKASDNRIFYTDDFKLYRNGVGATLTIDTTGNATFTGSVTSNGATGAALGPFGVYRQGSSGFTFTADSVRPAQGDGTGAVSGTMDIGASGNRFKDAYFGGTVNSGGLASWRWTQSDTSDIGLQLNADAKEVKPYGVTGELNLGASGAKFKNGYFSGTVNADKHISKSEFLATDGGSGYATITASYGGVQNSAGIALIRPAQSSPVFMACKNGNTTVFSISATGATRAGGQPLMGAKDLIKTLSTLRNATKDETTLEGMRDALADAIGGLIENLEHEISTMPAPEPEVSTMEEAE
jgi:hypothetical protein